VDGGGSQKPSFVVDVINGCPLARDITSDVFFNIIINSSCFILFYLFAT
jgi:hypothetical protein